MNESQRQQALAALLAVPDAGVARLSLRESGERASRGLEAYRANAEAIADRALAAAFPTVRAMVGDEDFQHLARECWLAHPPSRGDLGEWGDAFPHWLAAHAAMARWPWLADCARLDLALHRNERAADAQLDAASLALLESTDPARLRMQLMPGTLLLRSAWPIAGIHHAHQLADDAAEAAFQIVREAIEARRGEDVLVARKNWRACVYRLDAAQVDWSQCLLDGLNLADALERAGEAFDFSAWLATALRESWLKGVIELRD